MKIDVVLNPAEIDTLPSRDLSKTTAVVFDILRATSTITTALAQGAAEIFPVRTIEEARALRALRPAARLAGERHGDRIDGFDFGNSPLEFRDCAGAQIITTTTNGTVALRACEHAREVLAGAFLNLGALAAHLQKTAPDEVLLVCAGTFRATALEDVLAAGMLAARFGVAQLSDAALVSQSVYETFGADLPGTLRHAENGRALLAKNRGAEIDWCAQLSLYDVIGTLSGGAIRAQVLPG